MLKIRIIAAAAMLASPLWLAVHADPTHLNLNLPPDNWKPRTGPQQNEDSCQQGQDANRPYTTQIEKAKQRDSGGSISSTDSSLGHSLCLIARGKYCR